MPPQELYDIRALILATKSHTLSPNGTGEGDKGGTIGTTGGGNSGPEAKTAPLANEGNAATPRQAPGRSEAWAILLDADLGILAASPDEYQRYAEAIRKEYIHMSEEGFR
jgi:predicted metal-dependent HD superfamily phosphohydrolase